MKKQKFPIYLFWSYVVIWIILGIKPHDRFTWILENILPFIFVPIMVFTYKKFKLSNTAYTLIFIFMILHAIGAHYTYSHTPFFSEINGHRLSRDHYDRVIHFAYGLLMYLPLLEFISRKKIVNSKWALTFCWLLIVSFSGLYEIMEWGTAVIFSPEKAIDFTGTQGDHFDSQKDMVLAFIGAMISMIIVYFKSNKKSK